VRAVRIPNLVLHDLSVPARPSCPCVMLAARRPAPARNPVFLTHLLCPSIPLSFHVLGTPGGNRSSGRPVGNASSPIFPYPCLLCRPSGRAGRVGDRRQRGPHAGGSLGDAYCPDLVASDAFRAGRSSWALMASRAPWLADFGIRESPIFSLGRSRAAFRGGRAQNGVTPVPRSARRSSSALPWSRRCPTRLGRSKGDMLLRDGRRRSASSSPSLRPALSLPVPDGRGSLTVLRAPPWR